MNDSPHRFHRHPALPWAELRVSRQSPHCYRLHMHAEYSIGIVDQGEGLFQHADAAGGAEPVAPGSMVLIEPGAWHACNPVPATLPAVTANAPAHWSYRMLYVQADWLHARLGVAGLRFAHRAMRDAATTAGVDRLCQAISSPAAHADVGADAWTALLLELLRQPGLVQPLPAASSAATHAAIDSALRLLHDHPEQAPSVQAMARASGMSAPRFIRRFKAATGVTPGVYRLNLRINGARQLLAQGMALAEAAQAMGFADQAHLQRSFKAHHALTPGRYAQGRLLNAQCVNGV